MCFRNRKRAGGTPKELPALVRRNCSRHSKNQDFTTQRISIPACSLKVGCAPNGIFLIQLPIDDLVFNRPVLHGLVVFSTLGEETSRSDALVRAPGGTQYRCLASSIWADKRCYREVERN